MGNGIETIDSSSWQPREPHPAPQPCVVVWAPCKAQADFVPSLGDLWLIFIQTLRDLGPDAGFK